MEERTLMYIMCKLSKKRPVGRPRRHWVYNIERDATELALEVTYT